MTVNGTTITLHYDAFGRLFRKDVGGAVSDYFLWDGDQLFADLDSLGNKGVEYSYYPGLDSLHAIIVGSTPYFAHSDALGNVVALSDQSQNLARSYSYGIWGQSSGGNDNVGFGNKDRARWKGALWMGPEVDLYYLRNRWYGPTAGRFWSEDPIGLAGGINPYTFAGNDPVNGKDPTGMFLQCDEYITGVFNPYGMLLNVLDRFFRCVDDDIGGPEDEISGGGGGAQTSSSSPMQNSCGAEAAQFAANLAVDAFTFSLAGPAGRVLLRGLSDVAVGGIIRAAASVNTGAHLARRGVMNAWSQVGAFLAVGGAQRAAVGAVGLGAAYDVRQVLFGGAGSGSLGLIDFVPFGPSARALVGYVQCRLGR